MRLSDINLDTRRKEEDDGSLDYMLLFRENGGFTLWKGYNIYFDLVISDFNKDEQIPQDKYKFIKTRRKEIIFQKN